MSIRTRLQELINTHQKIQILYGMNGNKEATGRVLGVDHDHIDFESYVHIDKQIRIRRILVPLHLILHVDITTSETLYEEVYQDTADFAQVVN